MDGHTQAPGATAYPALVPSLTDLLHAAVGGVGGTERPGQVEMAQAVADAIDTKSHLLVQAGTGTGKSLAYLVPAVQHAVDTGIPAVVATATLALQAQIVVLTPDGVLFTDEGNVTWQGVIYRLASARPDMIVYGCLLAFANRAIPRPLSATWRRWIAIGGVLGWIGFLGFLGDLFTNRTT